MVTTIWKSLKGLIPPGHGEERVRCAKKMPACKELVQPPLAMSVTQSPNMYGEFTQPLTPNGQVGWGHVEVVGINISLNRYCSIFGDIYFHYIAQLYLLNKYLNTALINYNHITLQSLYRDTGLINCGKIAILEESREFNVAELNRSLYIIVSFTCVRKHCCLPNVQYIIFIKDRGGKWSPKVNQFFLSLQ